MFSRRRVLRLSLIHIWEEVDARGHAYGVVRRPISGTSFTHWARLNIDYDAPDTAENPTPAVQRTLRMGSGGEDVRTLQSLSLIHI